MSNSILSKKLGTVSFVANIGSGGFGTVYACYSEKLKHLIACKKIKRDSKFSINRFASEFDTWLLASENPFLVDLLDVLYDKNHIYFCQELLFGGVFRPRDPYSEAQKSQVVVQVTHALNFLHHNGIAHLDVKPENILIHSKRPNIYVKLHDFGISRHRDSGEKSKVGTLPYMAPEMLENRENMDYFYCDFYSLGITIFEIFMTRLPATKIGSENDILRSWGKEIEHLPEKYPREIINLVIGLTSTSDRKSVFDHFIENTRPIIPDGQVIDYKFFLENYFKPQHLFVYLTNKFSADEEASRYLEQVAKAFSYQKNYQFQQALLLYKSSIEWFLAYSKKIVEPELVSVLKSFLQNTLKEAENCKKFETPLQTSKLSKSDKNCTIS